MKMKITGKADKKSDGIVLKSVPETMMVTEFREWKTENFEWLRVLSREEFEDLIKHKIRELALKHRLITDGK